MDAKGGIFRPSVLRLYHEGRIQRASSLFRLVITRSSNWVLILRSTSSAIRNDRMVAQLVFDGFGFSAIRARVRSVFLASSSFIRTMAKPTCTSTQSQRHDSSGCSSPTMQATLTGLRTPETSTLLTSFVDEPERRWQTHYVLSFAWIYNAALIAACLMIILHRWIGTWRW